MTKNRNVPENEHEAKVKHQIGLQVVEAAAMKLYEMGQLTEKEARMVGQELMKSSHGAMTTEQWVRLRESPQWSEIEDSMRRTADDISSRDHEAGQDVASRKVYAKILSRAWADGHLSDSDYRAELNRTLHTHGDAATPELLVGAAVDILEPDPNHPVIWKAPPPPSMIGHATDSDMRYTPMDDRTNSPAARERRRAAKDADRANKDFDAKKAEEAARSRSTVERGVHYPDREEQLGNILNSALDQAERSVAEARFESIPLGGSGGDTTGGAGGEGGAAA